MKIQRKQLIFVLVILLAVIGLVGSGCLKNNDDSSNGTDTGAGNNSSNVTPPSSNNTSNNTTNNTTSNAPSSSLPDVVYATPGSGGGSNRGSSAPSSPATFNDQPVTMDKNTDVPGVVKWYFYLPSAEISGEILTLTMPSTIDDFTINSAGLIATVGDTATSSSYSGKIAKIYFSSGTTTTWDTKDLTIKVGDIDYEISFYASAAWKASATTGGSFEFVEVAIAADNGRNFNPAVINAGASKTFVSEERVIEFTLKPQDGYVGLLEVTDSTDYLVGLTQTGLNTYKTQAAVTPQTYTVKATFEKAASATFDDSTSIKIDQNLNSQTNGNTIYMYIPAKVMDSKVLTLNLPYSVEDQAKITSIDSNIINTVVPAGNVLTINLNNNLDTHMQKGGTATPNPAASFIVETSNGNIYNVSILNSAMLQIVVPDGHTVTNSGTLSLGPGTYNYVLDVGYSDTFSVTPGTLQLEKDGVLVSPLSQPISFDSAKYVLTVV